MALLTVSNVSRQERSETVLHPTSFILHAGTKLAIAGETGSGKTTLLKIIAGLTQATTGEVFLDNKKGELSTALLFCFYSSFIFILLNETISPWS